jgi:hypothetical protein
MNWRKKKIVSRKEIHNHLLEICESLDTDQNGMITQDEIQKGYAQNESFRNALKDIEVNEEDLAVLWTILDTGRSGNVDYTEFVTKCYNLRNSDTHFILAQLRYDLTMIKNTVCDGLQHVKGHVETVVNHIGAPVPFASSPLSQCKKASEDPSASSPQPQFKRASEDVDEIERLTELGLQILDSYFAQTNPNFLKFVSWMAGPPNHEGITDGDNRSARSEQPDKDLKLCRGKQAEKEPHGSEASQTLHQHGAELTVAIEDFSQKFHLMTPSSVPMVRDGTLIL